MIRVNIADAKARLSELIEASLQGDEVVIARRNTPLVRLVPVSKQPRRPQFGALAGRILLSADFGAPLADFAEYQPAARKRAGPKR